MTTFDEPKNYVCLRQRDPSEHVRVVPVRRGLDANRIVAQGSEAAMRAAEALMNLRKKTGSSK